MAHDDLRLMAKVADLYYRRGLKQAEISAQLGVHQSSISRLLKRAEQDGIVRISLNFPVGFFPELEGALEKRFGLSQAVIVDSAKTEAELVAHLGSATATFVSSSLHKDEVVGISSWSSSLLAMINAMHPGEAKSARVVQILGGVGNPAAEFHATRLTQRFAQLTDAHPMFLAAPGMVRSEAARGALLNEPYIRQTIKVFDEVTTALVGIGTVEPSPLLADSGNIFEAKELKQLRKAGAVGDICLRFFDDKGRAVESPFEKYVIGMTLEQLKRVPKVVGVAGGLRKAEAIHAALRGGWIDVLITDAQVAEAILAAETVP